MIRKIGILGGTFDPIHLGHLKLAEIAQKQLHLDTVLLLPSGVSYMKQNVSDSKTRLEMTRLAASDYPSFEVCEIEVRKGGNSYSFETLEHLKNVFCESILYFIVGADSFLKMDSWRWPSRIFRAASIAVLTRDDVSEDILTEKAADYKRIFNADITFLKAPTIDISSTEIRDKIKKGESVENLLSPSVYSYIKEHKLYI